jgi:Flp pilus assembly protein TadD
LRLPHPFAVAVAALAAALIAAWANHFHNGFHFDDFHTIVENPAVHSLDHLPRLLTDPRAFSTLRDHQSFRPVVAASLAFDHWLAGGLDPFWFHVDSFAWFVVLSASLYVLFRSSMDACERDPRNRWFALFGAALFGLHPASAETVNYVIQRAEIQSTTGVVAGLVLYLRMPRWRATGLYLVPVVWGMLAKLPAAVFAGILFTYLLLFEEAWDLRRALRRSLPALAVCAATSLLVMRLEAGTFSPTGTEPLRYRLTQPWVTWHYFASFFWPTGLSADSDVALVAGIDDPRAVGGIVFLMLLCGLALWASRRPKARLLGFGLTWFLLALAPTAWVPLGEVANDHRMFLPFVGLALAAAWAVRMAGRGDLRVLAVVAGVVLPLFAYGLHARNEVWRTEETLWRDVTRKSPGNARGHINYGLTQLGEGAYGEAVVAFERARALMPTYSLVEVDLGLAKAGLGRDAEAERHFSRALALDAKDPSSYLFYARWLAENGRAPQAARLLEKAVRVNPAHVESRVLLLQVYAALGAHEKRRALAEDSLRVAPDHPEIRAHGM